jgi:hypothetical protein
MEINNIKLPSTINKHRLPQASLREKQAFIQIVIQE